jgi:hypothetical protein
MNAPTESAYVKIGAAALAGTAFSKGLLSGAAIGGILTTGYSLISKSAIARRSALAKGVGIGAIVGGVIAGWRVLHDVKEAVSEVGFAARHPSQASPEIFPPSSDEVATNYVNTVKESHKTGRMR